MFRVKRSTQPAAISASITGREPAAPLPAAQSPVPTTLVSSPPVKTVTLTSASDMSAQRRWMSNSNIHNIGEKPFNGTQHGVGVYYRAFCDGASATGAISGNAVYLYQKGGIVANGPNTGVPISGNAVAGRGPIPDIAQNGIQIGFGGD